MKSVFVPSGRVTLWKAEGSQEPRAYPFYIKELALDWAKAIRGSEFIIGYGENRVSMTRHARLQDERCLVQKESLRGPYPIFDAIKILNDQLDEHIKIKVREELTKRATKS